MGFWNTMFRSDSGSGSTKVRQSQEDNSKIQTDRVTSTGGEKHVHESFKLNTSTGSYREYHGGENAADRSYNKK
ncbi:MAG: hypothetical protein PHC85_00565 [Candidatus Pacebacteria bacterium]|nr:hypothetical protein [Candidatus Paceibacterota bacterium]